MVFVGLSVMLIPKLGFWYLIPWVLSWFIYDLNQKF